MSPRTVAAAAAGRARLARLPLAAVLATLAPVFLLVAAPALSSPAAAAVAPAPPAAGSAPAGAPAPPAGMGPAAPPPPGVLVGAGATNLPTGLTAGGWLVADADSGQILAAKGADVRDLPASTMKILTALVVLPRLSPEARVAVGQDAAKVDGTKVGLVPGQTYLVRDLATAMLIASGNDATTALVDAAGGQDAVVARMNTLAASLGASDTHAVDPTGLDAPGQLTSVRDLAILGRAALAEPAVSRYLTIPRAVLPTPNGGSFEIQNHNLLLGRYPGTLGVKNGYTVAADATYVGAVRRDGRTLLVALLRAAPNYGVDARALLDWGFANVGVASPVGTLPAPPPSHSAGDPAPRSTAEENSAPAAGAVQATGSTGRERSGWPGWLTWTALGATALAGALTAVGQRRRQVLARRRAQRQRARQITELRPLPEQRETADGRGRHRAREAPGSSDPRR